MPTGSPTSDKKTAERKQKSEEHAGIPLPIQSFLWRQTNPFLGKKVGKLHEASCVTFERVVVQNILHGLSPSLSDAITSIPRWRFIRAAFPHVVQCCSALLIQHRQLTEDDSSEGQKADLCRLSNSLVKILYILHWMVFDSAAECQDSDAGQAIEEPLLNQHVFPVNCIQVFVYLLTPLVHSLKESDITSNIRLESGLKLWQALWEYHQPDTLCFAAPVKPRKSQLVFAPLLKKSTHATAAHDIYVGNGSGIILKFHT